MNKIQSIKLSMSIYKYINENNVIDRSKSYKKEDKVDIDDNFKAELKQRFMLKLINENDDVNYCI